MDFEFAPTKGRQPGADLTVYGQTSNGHSKPKGGRDCALSCQFSRQMTGKLGWVQGDRITAKWSSKDKTMTFVRVGVEDPALAYKVSFYPPKKKDAQARVRLGCPADALKVILEGETRATFSFFEAAGNKAVFVAN